MALTVGLIGIGGMGHGIGANLLSNGYRLLVLAHRSRTRVDDLISRGATEKSSAQEMAEEADVVILCVTGSRQVKDVMFGDGGLIAGARSGMLVIDCSTGEPDVVAEAGEELERRGVDFADAPLARTPREAAAGKLNTMVGASDAAFARARPILEAFCENIFHMGPVGAGTRTKLLNNLITMGQAALIAEALCTCKATGVDLRRFYDVISAGGGNSGIFQMIVPGIINSGSFDGMRFSIANAMKDLGFYTNMAGAANVEHPLGDEVYRILAAALAAGRPQGLVGELVAAAGERNHVEIGKLGQ